MTDLVYDPETGKLYRKGKEAGWHTHKEYRHVTLDGHVRLAHRVAWFLYYGEWPKGQIDHINGKRDDNRISNLREATNTENQHNRGKNRNNAAGFKGVYWNKCHQNWQATIRAEGRNKYLGRFATPEEASVAYNRAALKYHGDFANLDL